MEQSIPLSTGNKFQWCVWVLFCVDYMLMDMCWAYEWNSQQLTECITHNHCLDWLQGGIVSLPFFSVALATWIVPIPEWGNSWGSPMSTLSFLIALSKFLGKLEGRRPRLKLKRFLDWVLHQAVATEGACYSLHNAFESTLLNLFGTAFEIYYSWGVS
jgi:hypothetical protein